MTEQEIFDKVAKHIAKQGLALGANGDCQYRGLDGSKCAVGIFISDEVYTPKLEGENRKDGE